MSTIKEDITTFSEMIVKAFSADKLKLDYTLTSFKDIDRFYDLHSKDGAVVDGGRFSKNAGQILFALGAYIGQTITRIVPGTAWEINENDPEGEINVMLKLPDGTMIWPVQRAINRFKNGAEDGIYVYGYHVVQNHVNIEQLLEQEQLGRLKNPWWKIW